MNDSKLLKIREKRKKLIAARQEIEKHAPLEADLDTVLNFFKKYDYEADNKVAIYEVNEDETQTKFWRLYKKHLTEDSREERTIDQQVSTSYIYLIIIIKGEQLTEEQKEAYKTEILNSTYSFKNEIDYCLCKISSYDEVYQK